MASRYSVDVEEDILYQWRLRRRLEEARREANSEGTRRTHPHTTTLDADMENGVPGMGTGQRMWSIGVGLSGRTMLAPCPLAGATVTEDEEREDGIGTLTDLGVVSSSSEEHGGVKSPNTTTTTSCSSASSPGVNRRDEVVMTDSNSHTCTAKEAMDKQQTSAANMEDMTSDPLRQ